MAKQAKCLECKVRWAWKKEIPIVDCWCPVCKMPLKVTSYLLKWPVRQAVWVPRGSEGPQGLQEIKGGDE